MSDMVDVNVDSLMPNSPGGSASVDSEGVGADSEDVDNNANNNDVGSHNGVEPRVGMEFPTYIAAYNFYNAYARVKGFSVRISSSNYSRKTKELISKTFLCNKEGKKFVHDKRENGRVVNRRRDTRVGCKARLRVSRTERNTWSVSKFVSEHTNHEFTSPDEVKRHYSHRKLHRTIDCPDVMDKLQDAGLNPSTISPVINVAIGGDNGSKEVLEHEPVWILPCYASASPFSAVGSPQGSTTPTRPTSRCGTPATTSSLRRRPPSAFSRALDLGEPGGQDPITSATIEVFLITHGECAANLRPDLITGRWSAAGLTGKGERQARALAVFLKSQGIKFEKVYSSPLDRAMATAGFVCRELGFATEHIESHDALVEMSQGQWEGCLRSETYTPEMVSVIDRTQPDFSAPSGESLRQVEFRMMEFLNRTVITMPEKLIANETSMIRNESNRGFSRQNSTNSAQERDGPHWDMVHRLNRAGLQRKKSGKSRLQFATTGDNETEDEISPSESIDGHLHEPGPRNLTTSVGIFTHSTPITCLLTGVLGASPVVSPKFCIDDSSITVLQHSLRTGWLIKRLNDTSHLRLL